jgi:hypothetical protein
MKRTTLLRPLSRRTLLRGAGGVVVGLPLLEAMTAFGQTAPPPVRFIFMFSANGTMPPAWTPTGSESTFTLSPILTSLKPYQSKLLVLDNLDMESAYHGPGDGHMKGMAHLLTGTEIQDGSLFTGGNGELTGWGGGISVDQRMAAAVGASSKTPSLVLGVRAIANTVWGRMSYAAGGQPLSPENSPLNVFNRLFSDFATDPNSEAALKLLAQRKSVLDTVKADFASLNPRLGTADKAKVDEHLTAVRDLEIRLGKSVPPPSTCTKPGTPAAINYSDAANYPTTGALQMDLIALAMACNFTRVATLQWDKSVSGMTFPWIGVNDNHHSLSHLGDSDTAAVAKITQINTWYTEQYAYLLGKLNAVMETNGKTLLDNSIVVWGNELGKGNNHTRRDVPFVMAGTGGGYFRTGRWLNMGGAYHNDLWVSCLNAMGIPDTKFGNPLYSRGALAALR